MDDATTASAWTPERRAHMFWCGCVLTRVALVVLAAVVPLAALRVAAVPAAALALAWLVMWTFRLRPHGREAGGRVWWDAWRPVHAAVWLAVAWAAWRERRGIVVAMLALDVALGILVRHLHRHQ